MARSMYGLIKNFTYKDKLMNYRLLSLKSTLISGVFWFGLCLFSSPLQAETLDQLVNEALLEQP